MKQTIWQVLVAVGVLTHPGLSGVAVAEVNVGGYVSLSSDYTFRGVSQTMSKPALQAQIDLEADSGWYGYLWGANVDFIDSSEPDDGVDMELDVGLGYAFSLTGNSTLSLEAVGYLYPSAKDGVNYDYDEWITTLSVAEQHSLQIGYTNNVFGAKATGVFYAVSSGFYFAENYGVSLEVGHYRLGGELDTNYSYAELSMEGELESAGWWISYIATTGVGDEVFYATNTDDRFVLGLSLSF